MTSSSALSPKPLLFLTGNAGKLKEVCELIPEIESWPVDLPEIQSADARQVIEAKLLEAVRLKPGARLMVEDTSLYLEALGGLPGPLIKWFIAKDSLGLQGLYELASARGQLKAKATTWIGLLEPSANGLSLHFFQGTVQGELVAPRGNKGFGWDPIFKPEGSEHSFAEMESDEKQRYSMRSLALQAMNEFLSDSIK